MPCQYIYIYKGDDTNWNNEQFVTINVTPAEGSEIDLTDMKAKFILGPYSKEYNLTTGSFAVDLTAVTTDVYAFGPINGIVRVYDTQNRVKTITNTIPFYVTDKVIAEQHQTLDIDLPQGSPVSINLSVGGMVSYNDLTDKPSLNGVTIESAKTASQYGLANASDIADLQEKIDGKQPVGDYATQADLSQGLATKQDFISDLAQIRSNAELGASAVQPATLASELATKQDTLNASQLTAVNSGVDSVKVAQIATNATEISSIESKIPTQASASNQLADKSFVNSSINSLAAFYITSDAQGDPFPTRAALVAGPWYFKGELRTPTLNDYSIVTKDETHDDKTSRFMYDGTQWVWQYDLNNTTFTADQIAAINSGITSTLVTQIGTNGSAIISLQNSKQDVIGDLSTIRSGAELGATAVQPAALATKQDTLVSGTNIKTVNGSSLLGSGNVDIDALPSQTGQAGKFLTTDGTDASWAEVNIPNNVWTSDNLVAGTNISITQVENPVFDENTLGVWHFDGNDTNAVSGSTFQFTRSPYSYSSTISKFGSAFTGILNNGNAVVSSLGSLQSFTFDCWYMRPQFINSEFYFGVSNLFGIYSVNSNSTSYDLQLRVGNYYSSVLATLQNNTWYHIAFEKYNGSVYAYINGQMKGSYSTTDTANTFYITSKENQDYWDELRISNVSRYQGQDFTPYTEPYGPAGGSAEYQINNTQDISGKLDTSVAEETFAKKSDVKEYTAGDNISIVQVDREELLVSGFSNANYILLPGSVFSTGQMPWELIIKAKVPSTATTSQNLLFGPVYTPGQSIGLGINLDVTSDHELKGRFGLSSTGNSWDLRAWTEYGSVLQFDTWYWLKLSWDGTTYKFQTSTNGEQYTDYLTQVSSTPIWFTASNDVQLGNRGSSSNYPFQGYIDIRGCYISINNQTTFNGETAIENSDYYLVGDLNITEQTVSEYKINNTQDISGLIPLTQKAVADGVASLDSNALIPTTQLPTIDGGNANA